MRVAVGETVTQGQILFSDKKTAGVVYTSPVAGTIASINRGAKRAFISIVIDIAGDDAETFQSHDAAALASLDRQAVVSQMLQSGAWTALRTRPFSRVPAPESTPNSIFVTAMDSNPLAADPKPIIAAREAEFSAGLTVLGRLTDGAPFIYVKTGRARCRHLIKPASPVMSLKVLILRVCRARTSTLLTR